jgi:hypothetical protein
LNEKNQSIEIVSNQSSHAPLRRSNSSPQPIASSSSSSTTTTTTKKPKINENHNNIIENGINTNNNDDDDNDDVFVLAVRQAVAESSLDQQRVLDAIVDLDSVLRKVVRFSIILSFYICANIVYYKTTVGSTR